MQRSEGKTRCRRVDINHFKKMVQPALLRLCIALSVAAVLVALLAEMPIWSFIVPLRSPLLMAVVVSWAAFFVLRNLGEENRRRVVSAQGTGGDILQIATVHALPAYSRRSDGGDFAQGERLFRGARYAEAAESFLRAYADSEHPAAALNAGAALIHVADFGRARSVLEEAQLPARRLQSRLIEAALHAVCGMLDARQGNLNEALAHYESAAELFQREGDGRGRGDALINAANARVHRGEYEAARRLLAEAVRAHRHSGGLLGRANAQACRGYIQVESGDPDEALATLDRAVELYRQARSTSGLAHARMLQGNARFKRRDLQGALISYEESSTLCRQSGDLLGEASAKVNIGNLHFRQGDLESALRDYEAALKVHAKAGNVLGQARTLTNMGSALARQRRSAEALDALEQAQVLYKRIGAQGRVVESVGRIITRLKRRSRAK